MKIFKSFLIVFIIMFAVVCFQAAYLLAQEDINTTLQNKITEANEYLKKANEFHNAGEYDKAYENAEKAKQLTVDINQLKEQLAKKEEAARKIKEAKSIIEKAEGLQADKYASEELASAKSSLLSAENSHSQNNFVESLKFANESVTLAQNCLLKIEEAKKNEEETTLKSPGDQPETTVTDSQTAKIRKGNFKIMTTYKVKLIPERRDCLWRIAEYKNIYNNPWRWKIIYKANKDTIGNNPDLIFPGQKFDIPELDEQGNPVLFGKEKTSAPESGNSSSSDIPSNDAGKADIPGN